MDKEELFIKLKEYFLLTQVIFLSKSDEKQIEAEQSQELLTYELQEELDSEIKERL